MSFNAKQKGSVLPTGTLNLNTLVAGTVTGANTVKMKDVKTGTLSALFVVTAQTDGLVMYAEWQVSNDGTTWYLCAPVNGAATVALATGTAGADTATTKVIPANDAVYGWRYCRAAVRNTVQTGAATDYYAVSYDYIQPDFVG